MSRISLQNAGLFSAAAYTDIGSTVDTAKYPLPSGWVDITMQAAATAGTTYYDDKKNCEFRVFASADPNVRQIVIAFRGTVSTNLSNWKETSGSETNSF